MIHAFPVPRWELEWMDELRVIRSGGEFERSKKWAGNTEMRNG